MRMHEAWVFSCLGVELERDERFVERVEILIEHAAEQSGAALTHIDEALGRMLRRGRKPPS